MVTPGAAAAVQISCRGGRIAFCCQRFGASLQLQLSLRIAAAMSCEGPPVLSVEQPERELASEVLLYSTAQRQQRQRPRASIGTALTFVCKFCAVACNVTAWPACHPKLACNVFSIGSVDVFRT